MLLLKKKENEQVCPVSKNLQHLFILPLGFLSAHVRPLGAFQDFSQILTAVLLRGFCPLSLPKTGLRKIVPEDAVVQVI